VSASMRVTVSAMKATVVHAVKNAYLVTLDIHTVSRVPAVPPAASMMTSVSSASVKYVTHVCTVHTDSRVVDLCHD